ncbi:MAG: hypothetical protein AAGA86_06630 [Bacteroidota bacterium]
MSTLYFKLNKDWKEHFMLYASVAIIVSTCLGGLAIFSVFQNGRGVIQFIEVMFVVVPCVAVLASILTVQKPKVVLNMFLISLIVCFLISVVNYIIYH